MNNVDNLSNNFSANQTFDVVERRKGNGDYNSAINDLKEAKSFFEKEEKVNLYGRSRYKSAMRKLEKVPGKYEKGNITAAERKLGNAYDKFKKNYEKHGCIEGREDKVEECHDLAYAEELINNIKDKYTTTADELIKQATGTTAGVTPNMNMRSGGGKSGGSKILLYGIGGLILIGGIVLVATTMGKKKATSK